MLIVHPLLFLIANKTEYSFSMVDYFSFNLCNFAFIDWSHVHQHIEDQSTGNLFRHKMLANQILFLLAFFL